MHKGVTSPYQVFTRSWQRFPERNYLGTIVNENGERRYEWLSYDTVYKNTQALAKQLLDQKLYTEVSDPDFGLELKVVGICSINRQEWITTDLACNLAAVTTVPLYETLGQEALWQILDQTEMQVLFGSNKSLNAILKMAEGDIKNLKKLICFDSPDEELLVAVSENKLEIDEYHKIISLTSSQPDLDPSKINPKQIFTISYTSGTTGTCKGTLLSNEAFNSSITNVV